jgi:hypothetical protein
MSLNYVGGGEVCIIIPVYFVEQPKFSYKTKV